MTLAASLGLIPAHAGKTPGPGRRWRPSWAHPRSRGENVRRAVLCDGRVGSSPLTRGKLPLIGDDFDDRGLIPAHAGKTCASMTSGLLSGAHPRSRGENILEVLEEGLHSGSSPLTRGKPGTGSYAATRGRLIPAHAGKTDQAENHNSQHGAHPRSRGENLPHGRKGGAMTGSSPLTRGKPHPLITRSDRPGLIPAHAGKTARPRGGAGLARAHPRSRGENR